MFAEPALATKTKNKVATRDRTRDQVSNLRAPLPTKTRNGLFCTSRMQTASVPRLTKHLSTISSPKKWLLPEPRKGRVNNSTSPGLKNGCFDPKQCLRLSRLTDLFGVVWIARVHQHRDQCGTWGDRVYKLDLFSNETVGHADYARNIVAGLVQSVDKPYPDRIGP